RLFANATAFPRPLGGREPISPVANASISTAKIITSPVRRIEGDGLRNLALPAVAIGEEFRLVIIEFLARLGREFEVRSLDDGIDRTGLLAQPAINAFHHVDVVTHGAAGALVSARAGPSGGCVRPARRPAQLSTRSSALTIR